MLFRFLNRSYWHSKANIFTYLVRTHNHMTDTNTLTHSCTRSKVHIQIHPHVHTMMYVCVFGYKLQSVNLIFFGFLCCWKYFVCVFFRSTLTLFSFVFFLSLSFVLFYNVVYNFVLVYTVNYNHFLFDMKILNSSFFLFASLLKPEILRIKFYYFVISWILIIFFFNSNTSRLREYEYCVIIIIESNFEKLWIWICFGSIEYGENRLKI